MKRAALLAVVLPLAASGAGAGDFRLGAGFDYTSGDYGGTETITQVYASLRVSYRAERWGMRSCSRRWT
jgi:hypothetical protein